MTIAGLASHKIGATVATQSGKSPGEWWPSRWGAGDEAGASNWVTPQKVMEATREIRTGRIFRLGHVYDADMPTFGKRSFRLQIPGAPSGGPFGTNAIVANEDFVAGDLGQIGTTLDGLGHVGIRRTVDGVDEDIYYNGFRGADVSSADGLKKLGVEKLKPIFTRGHLIDLVRLKGKRLSPGQEIMLADVHEALARQGKREADIRPGDALLFRTGHGQLWEQAPKLYYGDAVPGIGMEVARWVIGRGLCLTGADTQAVEVLPSRIAGTAFPVHAELQTKHGILNAEDLALEELGEAGVHTFAYIFVPLPLRGATGSPGCPVAVT